MNGNGFHYALYFFSFFATSPFFLANNFPKSSIMRAFLYVCVGESLWLWAIIKFPFRWPYLVCVWYQHTVDGLFVLYLRWLSFKPESVSLFFTIQQYHDVFTFCALIIFFLSRLDKFVALKFVHRKSRIIRHNVWC